MHKYQEIKHTITITKTLQNVVIYTCTVVVLLTIKLI